MKACRKNKRLTFHTFSKQDELNGAYFNKHNHKKANNNLLLKAIQYVNNY